MAPVPDLRPFRGLRYDAVRRARPRRVLCPPYDVISPPSGERAALERDPHNAVRLELPDSTTASAARHARARWIDDGTLRATTAAHLRVRAALRSAASTRRARFFCRLRLEPYGRRAASGRTSRP